MPHVPGGYEESVRDDRPETNIRYGGIPQRVPGDRRLSRRSSKWLCAIMCIIQ